jgi:hypothetical protein
LGKADDDKLGDGFEVRFAGLNPLSADSDGDGTGDAAEDLDEDTLSNVRPASLGSLSGH